MKLRFIVILITISNLLSFAKENQVGVTMSSFDGLGFTFKRDYNKDFTYQITGFPFIFNPTGGSDLDLALNIGGKLSYTIVDNTYNSSYLFTSFSYWYLDEKRVQEKLINDRIVISNNHKIERLYNIGLGLGYEQKFEKLPIILTFDGGLLFQNGSNTVFSKWIDRAGSNTSILSFGFGFTICYSL